MDKMYVFFREFEIFKYNKEKALEDYKVFYKSSESILKTFKSPLANDILSEDFTEDEGFEEWFKENKNDYRYNKPIIKYLNYDYSKSVSENSREQRNNLLIDIMESILTHSTTAPKLLNPGGFEPQQRAARIVTILKNMSDLQIKNSLIKRGLLKEGDSHSIKNYINLILNTPVNILDSIASEASSSLNPLSPSTQITFHKQNMVGNKLIGIFANHNANHALLQHCEKITLKEPIVLNNKSRETLNDIEVDNLNISRNNAGWLSASVDDVKAKVLSSLNQNTFTANITMFLSKLGYNPLEIGLFLTQPAVEEVTRRYFNPAYKNIDIDTIIEKVSDLYVSINESPDSNMSIESMINNLRVQLMLDSGIEVSDKQLDKFKSNQQQVLELFASVLEQSNKLNDFVQATRADTQGGAAGPTIADSTIKILRLKDVNEKSLKKKYPFSKNIGKIIGRDLISVEDDKNAIRRKLLDTQLPFLQAFYSLGLENSMHMLAPYFPHFQKDFMTIVETLKEHTKHNRLSTKMLNNIYNELITFIMSKNDTFSKPIINNNQILNSYQTREYYLKHFPEKFLQIIKDNKDIASLGFIQKLSVVKSNKKTPIDLLIFKNVGSLSTNLRESYTRDWASLMYMENPVAQELARDLFLYNYFRNGFAFGPSSFIHLAPVILRKQYPGYVETLENTLLNLDPLGLGKFINQFIRNHITDANFVSLVDYTPQEDLKNINEIDGKILFPKMDAFTFSSHYEFIKLQKGDETKYFELDEFESDEDSGVITKMTYVSTTPLGMKNVYFEYEYGVPSSFVVPILDTTKIEDIPYISEEESTPKSTEVKEFEKLRELENSITSIPEQYSEEDIMGDIDDKGNFNKIKSNSNSVDAQGNQICK